MINVGLAFKAFLEIRRGPRINWRCCCLIEEVRSLAVGFAVVEATRCKTSLSKYGISWLGACSVRHVSCPCFFSEQTQSTFAFHCIEKIEFGYNPPRRSSKDEKPVHIPGGQQDDAKATGTSACPLLGFILDLGDQDMNEGWASSKMHSLHCFQIIHGVKRAMEARPLRISVSVFCLACSYPCMRDSSWLGPAVVIHSQEKTSCQ